MSKKLVLKQPSGAATPVARISGMTFLDLEPYWEKSTAGLLALARVENRLYALAEPIPEEAEEVAFIDTGHTDGTRVYMRTLAHILVEAVEMCYPGMSVYVEHSISGGLFCTLRDGKKTIQPDSWMKNALREKMRELIEADRPFIREEMNLEAARAYFCSVGRHQKAEMLSYRKDPNLTLYHIGARKDHLFGHLMPSTGRTPVFDVELFRQGLILLGIERGTTDRVRNFYPQYKLSEIYNENEQWSLLQGIDTVSSLNHVIEQGKLGEVIRISEQLQMMKIMEMAEQIRDQHRRVLLIAAPSSSGKTSFANKLRTALRVLGFRPETVSLDDYYVDREDTPKDENGEYDFESIHAIDIPLFNRDLNALLRGEKIERLRFEFVEGKRVHTGEWFQIGRDDPIIIEGIHGLNPMLSEHIPEKEKFRIYLSVITQINMDEHNRVPTSDLRLMRRMARDAFSRGRDGKQTIVEWPLVRKGEERNIFPFQEQADALFNSSFVYEIPMLRPIIEPMLEQIHEDHPAYIEAKRLKSMLQYFLPVADTSDVVSTSIFREFIGGSRLLGD